MIDTPPSLPSASAIEHRLVACGLDRRRISAEHVAELESVVIVVRGPARASRQLFACIHDAAPAGIVQFEEAGLQAGYDDYVGERARPQMLAEATGAVTRLELIEGFPRRARYPDMAAYADALARHCGLAGGDVLRVSGEGLVLYPPQEPDAMISAQRYEKLLAAILYAQAIGDLKKFGFIGNEVAAPDTR